MEAKKQEVERLRGQINKTQGTVKNQFERVLMIKDLMNYNQPTASYHLNLDGDEPLEDFEYPRYRRFESNTPEPRTQEEANGPSQEGEACKGTGGEERDLRSREKS